MNDIQSVLPHIRLLFNIEHPSFEECYLHGYECALAEKGEGENPYSYGSKESEQWLEGWWAGFYGEQPLYALDLDEIESIETVIIPSAANDQLYYDGLSVFLAKVIELTGIFVVSAVLSYQVIDLVA